MTSPGSTASCPKCGSTSLQTTQIKQSGVPVELVAEYSRAAGVAAGDTIPQTLCLRCGCRWIPRTQQERELRALSGQLGPEAMRAAQAQAAGGAKAGQKAARKIPLRTWAIAAVMVVIILLALLT